ncbi:MAG: GlcG/HbpS family heme-binding protein, partial [Halothiobacillaceae bacterium]
LKGLFAAAALGGAVAMPVQASEPMTAEVARVSVDVANTVAMEAMKACRDQGIPVSVTVVDRNGIVQVQVRDTTAPPVSLGISEKKAYTAIMFNAKGSDLEERAGGALTQLGEGLAFMAGSVVMEAGGRIYGAVGVSGAPDGMVDEECAVAGFQAVSMDLEML